MPKTPSNKLFQLIKSLSGSEKRYFKVFVNSKNDKDNKYIKLFDAIDLQLEFDEDALQKIIYGNQKIESRKYSELKAYLYDLTLKSLQFYDEKSSIDYKLKGRLQSVRALYKRSHFEACKEILYKAKKLAVKHENFNTILEILDWEKKIAYAETNFNFFDQDLDRIDHEEQSAFEKLKNISTYRKLFFNLLSTIRKDASRRGESLQKIESLFNHNLLESPEKALTQQSLILYYRIHSVYQYSTQNFNKFYEVNQKSLEIMEENPFLFKEDLSDYIAALSNLIVSCGYLKKYKEVEHYLLKMSELKPNTTFDELNMHRQYYQNFFAYCIKVGNFEQALVALPKHFEQTKKFNTQQFQQGSFYFQYFYIYFGNSDYEQALEYLNEWFNLPRSVERQDLQSIARILNLIIHYEMGNTLLLESLLRSTYRFLKKGERLFQFEEKMINFIKNTLKVLSRKELRDAFQTLKEDFEKLSEVPSEKAMLYLFNIGAWIDSKIENTSFQEIIQKQFKL